MNSRAYLMLRACLRVIAAFLLALLALAAGGILVSVLSSSLPDLTESTPWITGAASHTGMLVVSLVLILLLSKGRISTYGLRLPTTFPLVRLTLLSVTISALGFTVMWFLPAKGLGFVEGYSFLQIVLLVWIYASIAEEVLTRGLVQGFLGPLERHAVVVSGVRLSLPVLASAFLFAAMHLMLLTMGVDPYTIGVIVGSGFLLGIVAGYYREKTASVAPAIVVHALFNVTGSVLGLIVSR